VRPLAALVALLVLAAPAPAAAADWRELLERAGDSARTRAYAGEALLATWDGDDSHAELVSVRNTRRGGLTVVSPERYTMQLADDGGGLVDHEQGWFVPLPPADVDASEDAVDALAGKYRVQAAGTDELLERPCTLVDVRRAADGLLRERLWIDDASALILRRETYDADERLVRLAVYLSLDLTPPRAHPDRGRRVPLEARTQGVASVDDRGLAALRDAGWSVPDELPGGYEPSGVYAVSGADSQPLQVVYGDGLYSVSVFQEQGRADWSTLPPGAEPAERYGPDVYEWPGAFPQRLVWESQGTTFSLVGDAPPDEFAAIMDALPAPHRPGIADRFRRGLGRLWSLLSPWS
jgi:hypothetical protein